MCILCIFKGSSREFGQSCFDKLFASFPIGLFWWCYRALLVMLQGSVYEKHTKHTFHTALFVRYLFMGWQYMKCMKYMKHVFEQISQKVSLTKRAVWKVHFVWALLVRFLLWYLHTHMFHIYHVFSCHDVDRIHSKKFTGLYAWGLFNVSFRYFHIVSWCFCISSSSGVENWD